MGVLEDHQRLRCDICAIFHLGGLQRFRSARLRCQFDCRRASIPTRSPIPTSTPTRSMAPQDRPSFTIRSELRRMLNHRLAQIQNCRSTMRRRGCWCLRCSTRFSATSSVLGLKAAEMPETRRRTGPPPPSIYGISMKGLGPRFSNRRARGRPFCAPQPARP
jgi:hypothetical protein